MASVKLISEDEATGKLKALYDEIKADLRDRLRPEPL
jgi:hypothetical protein